MDWLEGMQAAIDYMEEHLEEELHYGEIAKRAYVSSFHFQRIFSLLCGFTVGDYIRKRRLTLAGAELAGGRTRVIDAALRFGYETPESFQKAFVRFHGVTPSAARKKGARLASFSRLSIKVSLEGGEKMDYRIEQKPAFRVAVRARLFCTEGGEQYGTIPAFWTECRDDGTLERLGGLEKKDRLLTKGRVGLCFSEGPECDDTHFYYGIGAECDGALPEGFRAWTLPAGEWAVFRAVGPMPGAIQSLWKRVYTEFFPGSPYARAEGADFEFYPDGDMQSADYATEIWVPVVKKA